MLSSCIHPRVIQQFCDFLQCNRREDIFKNVVLSMQWKSMGGSMVFPEAVSQSIDIWHFKKNSKQWQIFNFGVNDPFISWQCIKINFAQYFAGPLVFHCPTQLTAFIPLHVYTSLRYLLLPAKFISSFYPACCHRPMHTFHSSAPASTFWLLAVSFCCLLCRKPGPCNTRDHGYLSSAPSLHKRQYCCFKCSVI